MSPLLLTPSVSTLCVRNGTHQFILLHTKGVEVKTSSKHKQMSRKWRGVGLRWLTISDMYDLTFFPHMPWDAASRGLR